MKKYFYWILLLLLTGPIYSFAQKSEFQEPAGFEDSTVKHKELLIPNAFTPNNDGQNDVFKIKNITDERIIDFKVFNRWGTILFRTTDPAVGWDGTNKGQPQPIGVYGYVIQIGYPDGYVETYKGTVTLIK
jgi:gliding motility-associated-like protein